MISPAATPTKTRQVGSGPKAMNSWEKGRAFDPRPGGYQMPYLGSDGSPVGVKEFAEKRNTGAWDHPGRKVSS